MSTPAAFRGEEQQSAIKAAIAERIVRAAANGEIAEPPEGLTAVLYAWREWGNREDAAAYVQSITDTNEKLARFLNHFVYQTQSAGSGDRIVRSHDRLAMSQLSYSLDLDTLQQRLSHIDAERADDTNKSVITFVLDQLRKMQEKGLTPEQFDNSRFFLD